MRFYDTVLTKATDNPIKVPIKTTFVTEERVTRMVQRLADGDELVIKVSQTPNDAQDLAERELVAA